jgi:cytochrome c-type biogenesis protein CcmF
MGNLGTLLILTGLAFATFGAVAGLAGGWLRHPLAPKATRLAIWGFSLALIAANVVMVAALLAHDFSVSYVAQVGSRATPTVFTIVSLWSALEGSILFWGAILGFYLLPFAIWAKDRDSRFGAMSMGTMLAVAAFFGFLIVGPANPFAPTPPPIPLDGPGPNPYLQNHVLMIIHPPALYLGYVGFTVPFALAVGGLLEGKLPEGFGQTLRKWTLAPWVFLTLGIVFGGWWAYEVLGWGGYWAWDPVENASFLPWLTATAFIHSSMVQERRRGLRLWTLSLALVSFWLTILGTFMTRSGIFNSVHSFTQSEIGPMFLVFLGVVLVVAVGLVALRGPKLVGEERSAGPVSRETSILLTNLLFAAFTFTVFLGTVLPLVVEALEGRKISVGEPYFNRFAIPLSLMLLFLMGVGPSLPWGTAEPKAALRRLLAPALTGVAVVAGCLAFGLRGFQPLLAFGLAGFATAVCLREIALPITVRWKQKGEPLAQALAQGLVQGRRRVGGYLVHLGVIATAVGIAASSSYQVATAGTVRVGESFVVGEHRLTFEGFRSGREPHREWIGSAMSLQTAQGKLEMVPRLNFYARSKDPIGTPAVRSFGGKDLYLSLMTWDGEKGTASYRAWVFPLVGWIWWSMPLFVLGTLWAMWPARRRAAATAQAPAPVAAVTGGST